MLARVLSSRTVGLTAMNRQSSRSHAVLTLHIEQQVPAAPASSQAQGAAPGAVQGAAQGAAQEGGQEGVHAEETFLVLHDESTLPAAERWSGQADPHARGRQHGAHLNPNAYPDPNPNPNPNPNPHPHSNPRREWRTASRLAIGWLLNHFVFVALLLIFVSYGEPWLGSRLGLGLGCCSSSSPTVRAVSSR